MPARAARVTAIVAALMFIFGGCGDDDGPTQSFATGLKQRVTTAAVIGHLQRLQAIADANGGVRQTGTPGYDASVDYVANTLRDAGFDVEFSDFELGIFQVEKESLTIDGLPVDAHAVQNSGANREGVRGRFVALAPDTFGCAAEDYDGVDLHGAVVLISRGSCYLSDKAVLATERGASAVVIANDVDEKVFSGGLLEEDGITIPVLSVARVEGERIRKQTGTAEVIVDARVQNTKSRSVIATTETGSRDDVILVGAHLDSVRHGPGINDNGSGVAVVLETALQMGPSPDVPNTVRFAFWGGEEEWLNGSESYVGTLDESQLRTTAMYLNFDMTASPNPGYLVLDADLSTAPDPELGFGVPDGSRVIESAFVDYFDDIGVQAQDLVYDGRGDWNPFARAGVPVGGLSTGGDGVKTPEQARLWGGNANQPFDPNYHSADDTLANINPAALDITAPAVAYVVGLFAQQQAAPIAERVRKPL